VYRPIPCALGLLLSLGLAAPVPAQSVAGEVVRIDRAQGKLTLKHGPVPNLEMPAMTMAYRVQEPVWLDQLKVGDRVRFDAAKVGGQFTVMRLSVQP
jgi:Cu/Ag efflux protein CusF